MLLVEIPNCCARLWKEGGTPEVLRFVLKARPCEFDVKRALYLPCCTGSLPAAVSGSCRWVYWALPLNL